MARIWRSWRRNLLVTGGFSATIAIGMGSAAALVSLALALGYQPLPYRDPGQLVAVWEHVEAGAQVAAISGPDLTELRNGTKAAFATFGAFAVPQVWLIDPRGATQLRACYIEARIFDDLGIRPILGRGVRLDDDRLGSSGTAPTWISSELWRNRYGGNPSIIGTTIGVADSAAGNDQLRRQ